MKTKFTLAGLLALGLCLFGNGQTNASYSTNNIPVSGAENTALGVGSLNNSTTGSSNTAVGYSALNTNGLGAENVAIGDLAMFSNTDGSDNIAIGSSALYSCTNGGLNLAIGSHALFYNQAYGNVALGYYALESNTSGYSNLAIAPSALTNNTTGNLNIGIGNGALSVNTTGTKNTALGYNANISSGNLTNATAIGYNAVVTNNNAIQLGDGSVTEVYAGTGTNATLIAGGLRITGGSPGAGKILVSDASGNATWQTGSGSVWSITGNSGTTDGTNFIGTTDNIPFSIKVNNQKSGRIDHLLNNAFFGYRAGLATTSASNTAMGTFVLTTNTTGDANTAYGFGCMYSTTTGSNNTAGGYGSLFTNSTGGNNTAWGYLSLSNNTTGSSNTGIGYGANVVSNNLSNASTLGNGAVVQGSNLVQLGDANVTQVQCYSNNYGGTSDGRFKTNIREKDVKGLEFILRLRPVVYNMDTRKLTEFMTKALPDSVRRLHLAKDFSQSTALRQTGFIAQEVEKAAQEAGYDFNGVRAPENETQAYSLSYGQFVAPLVKALQEEHALVQELKQELASLKQLVQAGETGIQATGTENGGDQLGQNIPNPFSHETLIGYTLPKETQAANMTVYDLSGKKISAFSLAGHSSSITLSADKLAAGIYIYTIVADGKLIGTKRMIVEGK